jgi:hypothetical protein
MIGGDALTSTPPQPSGRGVWRRGGERQSLAGEANHHDDSER